MEKQKKVDAMSEIIAFEKLPADLTCTVTITGKQGDEKAGIQFEFDPPILKENDVWEKSGAGTVASLIMSAVKNARR